ncbi:MAG TPA: phosphoribosylanthranilate isomerase [Spirochaetota bacterium]|nr:phosphoribosylanthranilate isomerase [Spirochaetota bacterium]
MVKIKICGLTNSKDYATVCKLKADYAGFIFYPPSPRAVSKEKARRIITSYPDKNIKKVGVFVNADPETVRSLYNYLNLDLVQLHGDETPAYCSKLNLPYWKALRIKDKTDIDKVENYNCSAILVDSYHKKFYGGSGLSIPAELLQQCLALPKNIIAAGGLNCSNISQVLELKPWAVDINSGVEAAKGCKDHRLLQKIFHKIKNK